LSAKSRLRVEPVAQAPQHPIEIDVAKADDSALDAERVAQCDIQSAAEYRKPRGNHFAIRRRPSCRSALVEIDRGFATIDSTPQG
jgi:hypothetical protein